MARSSTANNIKAGAFVLLSIALTVAIVLLLSGVTKRLRTGTIYTVRFALHDGAQGLEVGSEVQIAGRPSGVVRKITFHTNADGLPDAVDAVIRFNPGLGIYSDAHAQLVRPLLGGGAWINFPSIGSADTAKPLAAGGMVKGTPAPPLFLTQAGYGPEQASQLRMILARGAELTKRIDTLVERVDAGLLVDAEGTLADIHALTSDTKSRSTEWFDRIDTATLRAQSAVETFDAGVTEGRDFLATLRESFETHSPAIGDTIANFKDTSENAKALSGRLNDRTADLLDALLEDGRQGVQLARDAVASIASTLAEESPSVRKSLANFRLASDQLRLTMGEVRRSPWRLLQRPNKKELEFELLYDAARSYAGAVSDLRAASESLEAAQHSNANSTAKADRVADVLRRIADAFKRHDHAEQQFLDLLTEKAP